MPRTKLVDIRDLTLHFPTREGPVQALRGVDLDVYVGETLGLVGESGCGKSQTALALLKLNPVPPGRYVAGEVRYHRRVQTRAQRREQGDVSSERAWVDILDLPKRELLRLRGGDVSMIFQDPMTSLNPVLTVGDQLTEAVVTHQDVGVRIGSLDRFLLARGLRSRRYRKAQRAARPQAVELLRSTGIPDAGSVVDRYPHELSGGMRQRVMIALSLACDPDLLVADEPTTALDVTIQAQILDLMRALKDRTDASVLLITHDLGVVAEMADRIAVMYAGKVVEKGPASDVFHRPRHPYTLGLLNSIPDLERRSGGELPVIPGHVPDMRDPPSGCAYRTRCPFAFDRCADEVPTLQREGDQEVACHLWDPGELVPQALVDRDPTVYADRSLTGARTGARGSRANAPGGADP